MSNNVSVKFNRSYTVQDDEGKTYESDKTYKMNEASANHFIKRGVAEVVTSKASTSNQESTKK